MKKHLQACEIGGSIYGKKRTTINKTHSKNTEASRDLISKHNSFYKKQSAAMDRIFRRSSE